MKVLVILSVLFAYSQATSIPVTVQERVAQAVGLCAEAKNSDKTELGKIFAKDILPEDNADFTDFFACYWKTLGIMNEDGVVNDLQIKVIAPQFIKSKYPDIENAEKMADDAVDNCKNTTDDSIGLKGIKYRNCLISYVKEQQE